jgi:polysaccharide biosynthesis protein PslH
MTGLALRALCFRGFMRILILTPRLPWPPMDGGRIAMARLAQSLARCGASVEILSLNPRKHHAAAGDAPMAVKAVEIDTARVLGPAVRSLAGGPPFLVSRFVSSRYRETLRAALQTLRPDIVQIESPFLLPYVATVRAGSRARVVLRSLNVEFRIWEELARNERNPVRRLALGCVAGSLRDYEVRELDAPDALVPISAADAEDFRTLGCTRPMHVVPCGITLPPRASALPQPMSAGFIGSLDFRPNQEAVEWILERLWPLVTRQLPEARLAIAGSSAPGWLRRLALAKGVEIEGDVADADAFMCGKSVMLAPLFSGGGMRIKVLEAMALGKPVVATTRGAGGLEVVHGRDLVIADDPAAFADALVRLLRFPDEASRMGEAARATVARLYDSDTLARGLLEFYETL